MGLLLPPSLRGVGDRRQYVESSFILGGWVGVWRCRRLAHTALSLQPFLLQRSHQVAHKLHLSRHLRG